MRGLCCLYKYETCISFTNCCLKAPYYAYFMVHTFILDVYQKMQKINAFVFKKKSPFRSHYTLLQHFCSCSVSMLCFGASSLL